MTSWKRGGSEQTKQRETAGEVAEKDGGGVSAQKVEKRERIKGRRGYIYIYR